MADATHLEDVEDLVKEAKTAFRDRFHSDPDVAACAPGRVNLIGEHTDYNNGFVFPMALPLVTVAVGKKTENSVCRVLTLSPEVNECNYVEFAIEDLQPGTPKWANYVKGVVHYYKGKPCPFDAVIVSSVPFGGGLSSSAALEVSVYMLLDLLTDNKSNNKDEKALSCQSAENNFANLPCGIMDQLISFKGQSGYALLIDCRSMESELVAMKDPETVVLITNSNVKHELTGTEYSSRRDQCKLAAKLMSKDSLRDAKMEDLEACKDKLDQETVKRIRHVITEIRRTEEAAKALSSADMTKFGKLMVDSHISLRDDYEVSCPELDQLVNAALQMDGVYGSRMTGGGFGGCTVTLVTKSAAASVMEHIRKTYQGQPTFYVCPPSDGARQLKL
ncbi:galactokinase isoform X1 [Octopus bimaculoides]|uniref:Galactokinase n=1 Tax=Octopus bimaculoides TaxID=37653 RepID=A0A0L8HES9_OCTBM|nr:galactokinase isoform X1 [Octopus bimaculoides]|eukprot:XP_014772882.1 PREDICTED: galactokinase-like isoform X1 [Octopus bimaculoides]